MNNKIKLEKFRGLSIAALVIGILIIILGPIIYALLLLAMAFSGNTFFGDLSDPDFILFFIISFISAVTGIVFGSIDIKRVKGGRYSNKGRGFDIAGIVMASIILILATSLFIDMLYPYMG